MENEQPTSSHEDNGKHIHETRIELPIQYIYPTGTAGKMANHLLVQHDQHEFHLSFFQLNLPIVPQDEDERKQWEASNPALPAECIAKVVLSRSRMKSFIDALTSNFEKSLRDKLQQSDEEGEQ
jgi:hypothetical protein